MKTTVTHRIPKQKPPLKPNKLTLFSITALAVGAALLLGPNARSVETKTTLNTTDSKFVQQETAAGIALVQIAELGVQKSERADITTFAGMLAADHKQTNAELMTLASSKGVEMTTEVVAKQADTLKKLMEERDTNFDKEFLSVIVKAHKKSIKDFQLTARDTEDGDLKTWAAKMLPGLQAHLEKAEELRSATTSRRSTGSATTTPAGVESARKSIPEPDNTARNIRDRDAKTFTPLDQGNSKADTETTAQIRKEILKLEDISLNAKNVKIITNEGHVTLRGPVNSADEKRLIGEIALRIVSSEHADIQLEVRSAKAPN